MSNAHVRGFTAEEFQQRLSRTQREMIAADIDALLLTTEADIRYYSGFLTQFWQSPARPWFLVVPANGKPIAVIPGIGEQCMQRTWIDNIRCWSSPDPLDDGVSLLADTLRECLGSRGRLGLQMGAETWLRMPLASFETVKTKLANTQFVDATGLVQAQQQVKSAAEVAKIAIACEAVSRAFERLASICTAGDSERAIFKQFKHECLNQGVDDVCYLVGAAAAGGYRDIISPPSDRTVSIGDVLILDTGCTHDGYFCDFDRNFAFGEVDQATADAYCRVHESIDAALELARPGATCAQLYQCMQAVLGAADTSDGGNVGRMGHGLGMQLTETPSITHFDQTEMVPGMVMTLEPGLAYGDGRIMVHEENIVITETGCQLLTRRAAANIPLI